MANAERTGALRGLSRTPTARIMILSSFYRLRGHDGRSHREGKGNQPTSLKKEMDVLLSTGEQISIALMAMALEKCLPVISLTGWQIGMLTNSDYGNARIKKLSVTVSETSWINAALFLWRGVASTNLETSRRWRGGSDTTAVAIAAAMNADLARSLRMSRVSIQQIPRSRARKLEEITYDEMMELASLGSQVLHNRSVELAKRYNVNLEVLSSFVRKPAL